MNPLRQVRRLAFDTGFSYLFLASNWRVWSLRWDNRCSGQNRSCGSRRATASWVGEWSHHKWKANPLSLRVDCCRCIKTQGYRLDASTVYLSATSRVVHSWTCGYYPLCPLLLSLHSGQPSWYLSVLRFLILAGLDPSTSCTQLHGVFASLFYMVNFMNLIMVRVLEWNRTGHKTSSLATSKSKL